MFNPTKTVKLAEAHKRNLRDYNMILCFYFPKNN